MRKARKSKAFSGAKIGAESPRTRSDRVQRVLTGKSDADENFGRIEAAATYGGKLDKGLLVI
jgi:hypothetical protein